MLLGLAKEIAIAIAKRKFRGTDSDGNIEEIDKLANKLFPGVGLAMVALLGLLLMAVIGIAKCAS